MGFSRVKKVIFSISTIFIVVITLEAFLQFFCIFSDKADVLFSRNSRIPQMIEDEKIGLLPNPLYPGRDSKGFRNFYVPKRSDIVVMGDSQTEGFGLFLSQTWPKQLEKITGLTIYSMACGGFSPVQGLFFLEEAIGLKPKLVIQAFYSGNDAFEAYVSVYERKLFEDLVSKDKNKIKEVKLAMESGSLLISGKETLDRRSSLREFLSSHSKIFGMLRVIKKFLYCYGYTDWKTEKKIAKQNSKSNFIYDDGSLRTIFVPAYRLQGLNLDDPRIGEGFRICLEALVLIKERLKQEDIDFLVLFIPTKEKVFSDTVYKGAVNVPKEYEIANYYEGLFWQKTKEFLGANDIEYLDSLFYLKESLKEGGFVYKAAIDGHLSVIGQEVLAKALESRIFKYKTNGQR